MPHRLGNFINAFNGGTRPNRFSISGTLPSALGGDQLFFDTHCLSATLPESNIGIIPIPYRGRVYKFPGDRTYSEWTVTVLDDTGTADSWFKFHDWSNAFNDHESNSSASRTMKDLYCENLTVQHLDHAAVPGGAATPLKIISLNYAWPVSVGPVQLDMGAGNQLASFQLTIAYAYLKYSSSPLVNTGT